MNMSKLLEKTSMIYDYIKVKTSIMTYMQVKPLKLLVEKHVEGLGFKLLDKEGKNAKILLRSKEKDLKQVLMLSYYSMPLSSSFIPEGFVALFMSNNMKEINSPFSLQSLYSMMSTFADLLKNEHMFDHGITRERTMERVKFFVDKGLFKLSDDMEQIWVMESALPTLEFFKSLILPLVDTYIIVLLAIE